MSTTAATVPPLGTASASLANYITQLAFLFIMQLCVVCSAVLALQREASRASTVLLQVSLTLMACALMRTVCVALRAVAHYGTRVHAASSPAQLLLLTSVLSREENITVGRIALATLLGFVFFVNVGLLAMLDGWATRVVAVTLVAACVYSAERSAAFFQNTEGDSPVRADVLDILDQARARAASEYRAAADTLRRRLLK